MKTTTLAGLIGCTLALSAHAADIRYLEPAATDLVTVSLPTTSKAIAEPVFNDARDPVHFSWAVDADQAITANPSPHETVSRQYWLDVTGAELAQGVTLHTTAPEALVRITPIDRAKGLAPAAAGEITITSTTGRHVGAAAVSTFADAESMKATGAGFAEGTIAFRVAPAVGSGALGLQLAATPAGADRFVLHVFEPASPVVLSLQSRSDTWLAGQPVVLDVAPIGTRRDVGAAAFTGYLASPSGADAVPLTFLDRPGGGVMAVAAPEAVLEAGLWEAHVFMDHGRGAQRVLRDAQTSFAIHLPTVRYAGYEPLATGTGVTVRMAVAAPGRYEARGVLYGSMADGRMVPIAAAHAAQWLDGAGAVSLVFDEAAITNSAAGAPYEIRHFELRDQSRMANTWRQERAFVLSAR